MGNPPPADGTADERAVLHAYELADGRWGWCYRQPEHDFELHSNTTFPTREEAVVSARRAYPDVPLAREPGAPPRP